MTKISIFIGGLLCAVGVLGYVITGLQHFTALLPVFIGGPVILFTILSEKQPDKRKLFMHIAVAFVALGFLGTVSRIPTLDEFGSTKSVTIWSTAVLCFILLGLYVQSFIKARQTEAG